MKKTALLAALLFAWPLLGQNPPATNPPAQNPPAQTPPAQTPPAQNPPKLEQPPMAAPEPEEEKKAAPVKKPETPTATTAPGGTKVTGAAATTTKPMTAEGKMVEEIVARVNNEIITSSELDKARASAEEDARQECTGKCTPQQLQAAVEERQKSALRDLIDQSLLEQRGKDLALSVETDVVKQLDQIRIGNNLKDMDELEKAVSAQGLNWEDFKNNIRNKILTQQVISREVGSHITIGHGEALKVYNEHKTEFVKAEEVALRAFEVSTEGKTEAEIPELKKKAESYLKRINDGEDFSVLAKRFSDGKTAQQGGYLGEYKRGELAKELEDKVFAMKKNEMTGVIETKQGFLILQVLEHYTEGVQPYDKVENDIMEHLYSQRMEPALREYLKTLREQSYVVIKPGYQEMAGGGNSEIEEVSATPETTKEKKHHKKYLLFGKSSGSK
ncbi:MAG TPA: peptidylprolyl isomerase [Candidatus Acidoferrum sp.]|nr:peptidylprolyl isomerase [Candidatus Acidoferrum sp.]